MVEKKSKSKSVKKAKLGARVGGGGFSVVNYPVGDFLVRLKNACFARKKVVEVRNTKLIRAVSEAMKTCGYLDEVVEDGQKLSVHLSYRKKEPVIMNISLISKPGLRVYMGVDELEKRRGPSVYIISTPKGVMASSEAVKKRLGGEVIAEIL